MENQEAGLLEKLKQGDHMYRLKIYNESIKRVKYLLLLKFPLIRKCE